MFSEIPEVSAIRHVVSFTHIYEKKIDNILNKIAVEEN